MSTVTASAPPAPLTFREVLRIDVIRRVWYAQLVSLLSLAQILGLVLSGTLAELLGVRVVFFMCAGLSLALVVMGKLFLHAKQ